MNVLKLMCLDCFCITRHLNCMCNISERINNACFKLYPVAAEDVTILSEGLVEYEPKRHFNMVARGLRLCVCVPS